jgi:MFS family permease
MGDRPAGMTPAVRSWAADARDAVRDVLGNSRMRRIELAWTAGIAGDGAFVVALLVAAFSAGGALAVGVLGVLRMAPSIVVAPLAGLIGRGLPPGRLLLLAHLGRASAAVATAIWLIAGGPLAGAFALATIAATAGALVRPLHVALMPSLARTPGELVAANVATSTGEGLGSFLGPLAAGIALALAGPGIAAVVAAGVLTAGALTMIGLPVSADDQAEHAASATARAVASAASGRVGGLSAAASGPSALRKAPGAATVLLDFAAQVFVRGLSTTLTVVAAVELLGLGDAGVGLLGAAYGLGGLLGAIGAAGLAGRPRVGPTFAVALALWGLPLAVIGALPGAAVAVAALLVSGVANAVLDIAGFTILQRGVPTESRVQVFGLLEATAGIGMSAGGLVAPLLLAAWGARGALGIAGAILPIMAMATWPRVRRADDEAVVPELELALLRGIPLFARLPLTATERLAGSLEAATFAAGETIMREGDEGDRYLIISDGEVEVTAGGRLMNRCGAGEGVGEIALLHAVPRTATVVATRPTSGFYLSSAQFLAAIAGPTSAAAARDVAAERLARTARGASAGSGEDR